MVKFISTLAAVAAIGFGSMAVAGERAPTILSDAELDAVVAGQYLYVYENNEGGYAITPKQHTAWDDNKWGGTKPGKMRGNGNWDTSTEDMCDTGTGNCTNGTIALDLEDEWVYTPNL